MENKDRDRSREFWHCYGCGNDNQPEHDRFCSWCGRNKEDATDKERWHRFFSADAVITDANPAHDQRQT